MIEFDDPRTVQFCLGGLVCQLSVLEFGIVLGLYTEEFMDDNELDTLHRHIHYSPSKCWKAFVLALATYDPSRSKASALTPSLRCLHAILAHTLTGRRESTDVVNTHDAYFLWSIANGHVFDLAYFIAFTIYHQTERHRKGFISISPYVTRLARYFELLNTAANHPPSLSSSTEEEDPEDITDNVPPLHEDPPSQPPPIHRPVHAVASYSNISERLTRFE
ncbi:hypothetical protein PVK06_047556 [Gossypium arboreum]|uniref:Uncharacterized protein n=1 Tax=Gossypium arboreum TaxID=29729 RepID=A0ABR0MDX8_GOSAR|nr:hypothetical protein PVK06_047556 [Gossypium arboreum]